jgi:hypothetical protein
MQLTLARRFFCAPICRLQRQPFDKDDNDTYRYICFAIVRIATTLGADFAPYLQVCSWVA